MTTTPILSTLTGDNPRARRSDPVTSHEAADSITIDALEASEVEVLTILGTVSRPITADEIIRSHGIRAWSGDAERAWTDSRIRTAISQLRKTGRVVADGRGKTRTGRSAEALRLANQQES